MIRVLDDSILNPYNDSIKKYKGIAKETLGMFNRANGKLTGSNPFMLVHLSNSGLLPEDVKLATRKDLETALSLGNNFLEENHVDFGLALRSVGDSYSPNDLPAKRLAKQLKSRGVKNENGKLISFTDLKLKKDENSPYGLVFELKNQTSKDNILDLNGFKWDYTRDEGLSRAYFYGQWCSYNMHLSNSPHYGRVVVVNVEGN